MSKSATLPQEAIPMDAVVERTQKPIALPSESGEVIALLRLAVERGVPVEALEKLVALQERYQDRAAQREFARAFAEFQQECPSIPKLSTSKKVDEPGAKFAFTYADLDTIASTVAPYLHKHGFSYSWNSTTTDKLMTTVCTLRHEAGHRESSEFTCPTDSSLPIGTQQKSGSALSYGRRYSLIQVLGITSADPDNDGDGYDQERVTPDQIASLEALMDEVRADRGKFLVWLRVGSLSEIRAKQFNAAIKALEQKRKGA